MKGKYRLSAVLIEHVKVSDLPESWRARLAVPKDAQVTFRIEEERPAVQAWRTEYLG